MTAQTEAEVQGTAKLHRVLGMWDLALLSVAAVTSLRLIAVAAQSGPASIGLWILGLVAFFIPLGLAIMELSSRMPGEGGFYLWTRAAFGNFNGFVAGWSYVTSNLVYFPSLILGAAGSLLYVGGKDWLWLGESRVYNIAFCVISLWFVTWVNIIGLKRAKWLSDFSGIATWVIGAVLVVAGAYAYGKVGAATAITPTNIWPDFTSFAIFGAIANVALAYVGIELGPIMGGEIKDPRRTIGRAVLIGGAIIATIYILGTAALLVALPSNTVDPINGVPQALTAFGESLGIPGLGAITALAMMLATIGGLSAWLGGTGRLPFVFGIDRYLPSAMGRLHPRYATPHYALLAQSIAATFVLILAAWGGTVREAFTLLLNMTTVLSLLPLLYIFASLAVLRWRAGSRNEGIALIPGGPVVCTLVAALGFLTTACAIVFALIPPANADPATYLIKALGGCAAFLGIGLIFFWRGSRAHAR